MTSRTPQANQPLPDHVKDTIDSVAKIAEEHYDNTNPLLRGVEWITSFVAKPEFFLIATAALFAWIGINMLLRSRGYYTPDPPPFSYMAVIVTVISLYLTILILVVQSHESKLSTQRDQLTLHMSIISEQKSAKIIALLEKLKLNDLDLLNIDDAETKDMSSSADPKDVLDAIKERDSKAS